jgi:2-oxo-4-hydroxy-4-carboxy-5-ureidoimidazoline decarboxylase
MTIAKLNSLKPQAAADELFKCCGSTNWAKKLSEQRPFKNFHDLVATSDEVWQKSSKADGLEAFTHHPKIGDIKNLEKKFAATKEWAGGEQAAVNVANQVVLQALEKGNEDYEKKFGFIFIVCASGKSAEEMLALLNERMGNDKDTEIKIAMAEQNKITKIRLKKLVS